MSTPKPQTTTTDHSGVPSRDEILARAKDIAVIAARDAALRERQRELPFDIFALIKEARSVRCAFPKPRADWAA